MPGEAEACGSTCIRDHLQEPFGLASAARFTPRHKGEHNVFPTSIHPPDRLKGNLQAHLSPLYASKEERWRYDDGCNDQEGGTGTNQVADRFGSRRRVSVVEWFRFVRPSPLSSAPYSTWPTLSSGGGPHDLGHARAPRMAFALGRAEIMNVASVFESLTSAMPNQLLIARCPASPPSSVMPRAASTKPLIFAAAIDRSGQS